MKTITLGITAACGLLVSGCITHESTVTRDVERAKIEFENDAAGRLFYQALGRAPGYDSHKDTTTKFEIPVIFEYKRHTVVGSNAAFNRAVELCDVNKDGKITEQEARIFAEQKPR